MNAESARPVRSRGTRPLAPRRAAIPSRRGRGRGPRTGHHRRDQRLARVRAASPAGRAGQGRRGTRPGGRPLLPRQRRTRREASDAEITLIGAREPGGVRVRVGDQGDRRRVAPAGGHAGDRPERARGTAFQGRRPRVRGHGAVRALHAPGGADAAGQCSEDSSAGAAWGPRSRTAARSPSGTPWPRSADRPGRPDPLISPRAQARGPSEATSAPRFRVSTTFSSAVPASPGSPSRASSPTRAPTCW